MPIVVHLSRLDDGERRRFFELLDRARTDRQAQAAVREELRASAAIRRVLAKALVRQARARRLVDETEARHPGRSWLLAIATSGLKESDLETRRA
jgi:hypothetical protein